MSSASKLEQESENNREELVALADGRGGSATGCLTPAAHVNHSGNELLQEKNIHPHKIRSLAAQLVLKSVAGRARHTEAVSDLIRSPS